MRGRDLSPPKASKRAPSAAREGSSRGGEHAMPTSQSICSPLHGRDKSRPEFAATALRRHELLHRRRGYGRDMGASLDLMMNTTAN